MIKAVLFDLDNTLIDFMTMKRKSCEAAVEAMVAAGLKEKKSTVTEILFELYDKHGIEYGMIFQELLKKLMGKVDYRILAEGIVAYRRAQASYMRPYPNAKKTLIALRSAGIRLGIVSDAPSVNAWIRLVELGIQDFFDAIVTFHDTGERKPSPLPFRMALDRLGVSPGECLFVGDWVERDIAGAKALGMKTAFAKYGAVISSGKAGRTKPYRPEKSGANYDVNDVSEIIHIVKQRDLSSGP